MGIKTASTRRAAAASAVSSQSVVINTSTGLSTYSVASGVSTIGASSSSGPVITNIIYTDASFVNTSANASSNIGGNIKIIGTGFTTGSTLYLSGNLLASNTYVSSTEYRATLPATSIGTYTFTLFNSSNVGAIWTQGIQVQSGPIWTAYTLTPASTSASNQLSATGAVSYAVTSGSLPGGLSLSSSGLLSGTFTGSANSPVTFTVTATNAYGVSSSQAVTYTYTPTYTIQYLVVAGGGAGGGYGPLAVGIGGGGGAGGLLTGSTSVAIGSSYPINIGAGGAATSGSGNFSNFGNITSTSGGGGGYYSGNISPAQLAKDGGSGGGAGSWEPGGYAGLGLSTPMDYQLGGSGTNYPGPTQQGYPGGATRGGLQYNGAGGGGAGGAGGRGAEGPSSPTSGPSAGGTGVTWTYTGPAIYYAGGGGGGGYGNNPAGGTGGSGGGGAGGPDSTKTATPGSANTGGGGGGVGGYTPMPNPFLFGSGGSGVVIIAVPTPNYPGSAPGATVSTPPAAPGMTVLKYTSSGTYTA